ncbi:malectin-like carbohydrate-binding domain-containing protein [Artemisia annua]|uniref:Malectin-like carbohydrate-binding domain-containing protein n=1 Tax=Artemisia annua TaxID=35608 RepID=A0A2U1LEX4_ARTAN|nr:malectin-like carbohydrate-binding domain-containing protein [Artemisia annua]
MDNRKQKVKNLADNNFSGPIPSSLSTNSKLNLNVTGNPSLCTSGMSCSTSPGASVTRKKKKSSMLPIILGITIPMFFLVLVALGTFIIRRRKTEPANINMPTRGRADIIANENIGGGVTVNPGMEQRTTEEMGNEGVKNAVPQAFVPPLSDSLGQSRN